MQINIFNNIIVVVDKDFGNLLYLHIFYTILHDKVKMDQINM